MKQRSIYYVTEKDLYFNTLHFYQTGEFVKPLADDILKMTKRIVGSRRFDSCSDILREEMVSRAYTHACAAIMMKKYSFKHGSRVYSWLSRVLINECLKAIEEDQKRAKAFRAYAESCLGVEQIEVV